MVVSGEVINLLGPLYGYLAKRADGHVAGIA